MLLAPTGFKRYEAKLTGSSVWLMIIGDDSQKYQGADYYFMHFPKSAKELAK